jgi:hypothetical protein
LDTGSDSFFRWKGEGHTRTYLKVIPLEGANVESLRCNVDMRLQKPVSEEYKIRSRRVKLAEVTADSAV